MVPSDTLEVRIAAIRDEAVDIRSLELVPVNGQPLPAFSAGSHIDVHLPGGLVRPYSLCNPPAENHRYLIGVLRDPASRGGSVAVHQLQPGQALRISRPRNHFALAPRARRHLLLAGGIGLTPLLAMAEQLAADGADFMLHVATRSPARTAFATRLAGSAFVARVRFHHDDGPAGQRLDLAAVLARPDTDTHVYFCGPKGFMDAVQAAAQAAGWPTDQLHLEHFSAAPVSHDSDAAFEVELASTGRVIAVGAEQTVVQALRAAGVDLVTSCEQGVCGTCITRVIAGQPDHRDLYLTADEQARGDQFTPCCSRSRTPRLVLDL